MSGMELSLCQTATSELLALVAGSFVLCVPLLPLSPSYPGLPPPLPPPHTPSTIVRSFLNAPALSGSLLLSLSLYAGVCPTPFSRTRPFSRFLAVVYPSSSLPPKVSNGRRARPRCVPGADGRAGGAVRGDGRVHEDCGHQGEQPIQGAQTLKAGADVTSSMVGWGGV